MDVDESAVLTLQEVADYLQCHYTTVYLLARRGDIPSFRLARHGGGWRFLKSEIDEWIAKGGGGKPPGSAPAKTDGSRRGRKPKPKTTKP